jgi:SLT domain-containing protein
MNVLIERESSWNANIVNTWDSNAKAGHPSGGLTQTIIGTFESNRNHSLPDNMFDPVANIAASINYIRHTYGDISRVQQANPNLPKKGYDNGGALEPGWSSVYNGTGKPENVRTAGAEDALMTAVKELTAAVSNQQSGGGMMTAKLFAHDGTFMGMVSGQVKQTVTGITRQFGPLT